MAGRQASKAKAISELLTITVLLLSSSSSSWPKRAQVRVAPVERAALDPCDSHGSAAQNCQRDRSQTARSSVTKRVHWGDSSMFRPRAKSAKHICPW